MTNGDDNRFEDIRAILREIAYGQSLNTVAIAANSRDIAELKVAVAGVNSSVAELKVSVAELRLSVADLRAIVERHQENIEQLQRQ